MLSLLYRNLLSNAIKFSHSGGMILLNTQLKRTGYSVPFSMKGLALPPDAGNNEGGGASLIISLPVPGA